MLPRVFAEVTPIQFSDFSGVVDPILAHVNTSTIVGIVGGIVGATIGITLTWKFARMLARKVTNAVSGRRA